MTFAQNITRIMMNARLPSEPWRAMNREYIEVMLPELAKTQKAVHRQGETVFEHTMKVLEALETKNPVTLWAAIFHDLGKASFPKRAYFSEAAFPKHEIISAHLANRRLERWEVNAGLIFDVVRLVRHHMTDIAGFKNPQAYRNFIASVGLSNVDNWFILRRADSRAYGERPMILDVIEAFRARVADYLSEISKLAVADLAVSPEQLASELALQDEEQTGRVVDRLLDAVNSGVCGNRPAQLINAAHLFAGMGYRGKGIVLG